MIKNTNKFEINETIVNNNNDNLRKNTACNPVQLHFFFN